MSDTNSTTSQPTDFPLYINKIQERIGKQMLCDDELIALALYEISRTYTRDERNYE